MNMKTIDRSTPIQQLEASAIAAAETYANVHRGEGHFSLVSTKLYEHAREAILRHLELSPRRYTVIFCTAFRARQLKASLTPQDWVSVSSAALHLPLGIHALAVRKKALPRSVPFQTGGGAVKMVSLNSVVWADAPDRFEAGTPSILHAITFARALQLTAEYGKDCFLPEAHNRITVEDILLNDPLLNLHRQELLEQLRPTLLGAHLKIPTTEGLHTYVQLDNAASTPAFLPIWQAARKTWQASLEMQQELAAKVKGICADFFNAPLSQYETIFTSNTTEAVNLAALLLPVKGTPDSPHTVINTLMEHHSNDLPWRYLDGVRLVRLDVDQNGFINLDAFEDQLRQQKNSPNRVSLVTVCGASNVLGTFNDLPAISKIAHRYGALLMVDAAQMAAHHPIDMQDAGIDCLTFSGHKMHAPFGTGGLIIRKDLLPAEQEELNLMRQSGEENAAGIAALGKTMLYLQRIGLDLIAAQEQEMVKHVLEQIHAEPRIHLAGIDNPDSPRLSCRGPVFSFEVQDIPYNLVARLLALQGGVGVRTGCFCAHPIVKHLMGINKFRQRLADIGIELLPRFTAKVVPGYVRVSFGLENTLQDAVHLMQTLKTIFAETNCSSLEKFLASTHNGTTRLPAFETRPETQAFITSRLAKVFPEPDHVQS